jgi:septation ring formation regulator EzrA
MKKYLIHEISHNKYRFEKHFNTIKTVSSEINVLGLDWKQIRRWTYSLAKKQKTKQKTTKTQKNKQKNKQKHNV